MRRIQLLVCLGLAAALSSGCSDISAGAASGPVSVTADAAQPSYRLGPGDKLRVITFGEQSLSGEFIVNELGKISLPLVGDVAAGGLTIDQFTAAVTRAFANGFLINPRVSVEVLNYRPYYILGEVAKPGEYPFVNGLTVVNAAATAGGFTYRANTHKVFIRHTRDTSEAAVRLTTTTPVLPGDTIRIPERFF